MMQLRASFTGTATVAHSTLPPGFLFPGQKPPAPPRVQGSEICQTITDWQDSRFPAAGMALVEQKHDGARAIWHSGDLVTRNEAPIRCAGHLLPGLLGLERALGGQYLIDAEYVEPGGFDATVAAIRTARPRNDGTGLLFVFDAVPLSAWEGRTACPPLIERKAALRRAMADAPHPFMRHVGHAEVHSIGQVRHIAAEAWARGHEGIVVKDPRSIYHRGRCDAWQRLKRAMTAWCEIISIDETPHRDGPMGTLVVAHRGKPVRVVAGFSPDERRQLLDMRHRLPGRRVEIEAMEVTATGSLRQPRFSRWEA